MKIVVDIPRKYYEDFKLQITVLNKEVPSEFAKYAIATGVPLPKGHGDLIDRGQALNECYDITIDGDVFTVVQYETLLGVPTIIEADTESEDKE